jgi:hypothetical protein
MQGKAIFAKENFTRKRAKELVSLKMKITNLEQGRTNLHSNLPVLDEKSFIQRNREI